MYAPKINKALKEQVQEFTTAYKRGDADPYMAISLVPIIKVLRPLYLDAAVVYGAKVIAYLPKRKARMPIGYSERMQLLVEQYFAVDFLNDSQGITETTKEQIRKILLQASREGLGIDDTLKLLEAPELTRYRSRLIARTETVSAANFGASAAANDTGLVLNKVWIAARDNRTRIDHASVNGTIVPQKETFIVGGYAMLYPGDRGGKDGRMKVPASEICNCRCSVGFIPVTDANGKLISL